MAANEPVNEAGLSDFLEAAGRSLAEAQGMLGGAQQTAPDLLITNADLEVKTAMRADAGGKLVIQPISAQDLAQAKIDAGALSTVRVSFVAAAPESPPGGALGPTEKPARTANDVINDVRERPDVAQLDRILGGLNLEAIYVPQTKRWLVTAQDSKGRVVREVVLPDVGKEVRVG